MCPIIGSIALRRFKLTPDASSHTAFLSSFEHPNIGHVVTAITKIDKTALGTKTC